MESPCFPWRTEDVEALDVLHHEVRQAVFGGAPPPSSSRAMDGWIQRGQDSDAPARSGGAPKVAVHVALDDF